MTSVNPENHPNDQIPSADEIQERVDALSTDDMTWIIGWLIGGDDTREQLAKAIDARDRVNADRAATAAARA